MTSTKLLRSLFVKASFGCLDHQGLSAAYGSKIFCRNLTQSHGHQPLKISVLGAAYEKGQPHDGLCKAPELIRQSGLIQKLQEIGHDVKDEGDIVCSKERSKEPILNAKNLTQTLDFNKELSNKVCDVIKSGRLCVTLGGDHSIGLGTVYGHAKAYDNPEDLCVIWVDAHADMNTPGTSPSGNMHGMPVSLHLEDIFKTHYQDHMHLLDWFKPCLATKRLAFIGLREIDPHESVFLDQYNIPAYSMKEVDRLGIKEVVKRCLDHINPDRKLPLHVSFDIDSLDPSEAPATGTPVPGGLSLREGLSLLEEVHQSGCLRGLDLVEVNPALSCDKREMKKTVEAAKRLILAAMGFPRRNSAI